MKILQKIIILFLFSISTCQTTKAVTPNHCFDVNNAWSGNVSFSGTKFGRHIDCYGGVIARAYTTEDNKTKINFEFQRCHCNNSAGCFSYPYTIYGTCIDNKITATRSDYRHGEFKGYIKDKAIVLRTSDDWWIKLYK